MRSTGEILPWAYRREIGRLRAYWRTVWLVTRRPKQLSLAMSRPVAYRDAQRFRWVTWLHVVLTLLGVMLLTRLMTGPPQQTDHWYAWGLAALGYLLICAFLAGAPGVASYFFHPRRLPIEQQNRAIALSYYAWAPLAVAPLALALYGAAVLIHTPFLSLTEMGLAIAAVGLLLYVSFAAEVQIYSLQVNVLHRSASAALWRMVLLNLGLASLVLALLAIGSGASLLYLVWESLS
ncbi:MAG: hypothetical protein AB1716_19215 [Planctomycetota bacterium]